MDRLTAARVLDEIGRRLQIQGAEQFRAKAFIRGAAVLQARGLDLDGLVREGRLQELPGIGSALEAVIAELYRTGHSTLLERLRAEMPAGVVELSRVLSLPRIRTLQAELGIDGLQALESACRAGQVRGVRGFGPRTEQRLLDAIAGLREGRAELHLHRALQAADELVEHMLGSPAVQRADVAGDVRRRRETVSSFPLVVTGRGARAAGERLLSFPLVESVTSPEPEAPAAILSNGLALHMEWVAPRSYGTALAHRTGAESHWARLDALARAQGATGGARSLAAADEPSFYAQLGLQWIPPELREDGGEIEAAREGLLPKHLLTGDDIRGMVHCHTNYSDGNASVLEMARAAERFGMSYITITDHSPTAHYAGGLTVDRLERQWEDIARAQEQVGIRILRGTESDILADGGLDYPDSILERLDLIVASVHNRYRMDAATMTHRVTRALALPLFKIWGHARGRIINRRPPFDCDMDAILDVAAGSRVAVEVNGDPHRLDMDPFWIRVAKQRGLPFVVSVDAHSTRDFQNLRYGVDMARRGWLERADVLNTLTADEFAASVRPGS